MIFKKLLPFILILFFVPGMKSIVAYGNCKTFIYDQFERDSFPGSCSDTATIKKIIDDAISLGAPVYNAGLHMGCYRIYEWAAYKILYIYGSSCKDVEKILKGAVEKSHGDYSDIEKAWIMRVAFDKILGVPTQLRNQNEDTDGNDPPPIKG